MKNEDLFVVGLIKTLIITIFVLYYTDYQAKKEYVYKIEAMQTAIYLNNIISQKDNIIETLKQTNEKQNEKVQNAYKHVETVYKKEQLLKELRSIEDEYLQDWTLALCYTESSLNKSVVHKGRYDKTTKGICGIKTLRINEIPELTHKNINTLYAGSLVLEYLLAKNNYNMYEALKDYKGAIKNTESVDKVFEVYNNIKKIKSSE